MSMYTNDAAAESEPTQEQTVDHMMDRLSGGSKAVEEVLHRLENRLSDVLLPEYADTGGETVSSLEAVSRMAPLASRLETEADHLYWIARQLQALEDRIGL